MMAIFVKSRETIHIAKVGNSATLFIPAEGSEIICVGCGKHIEGVGLWLGEVGAYLHPDCVKKVSTKSLPAFSSGFTYIYPHAPCFYCGRKGKLLHFAGVYIHERCAIALNTETQRIMKENEDKIIAMLI